jgi:hypothetical protein
MHEVLHDVALLLMATLGTGLVAEVLLAAVGPG